LDQRRLSLMAPRGQQVSTTPEVEPASTTRHVTIENVLVMRLRIPEPRRDALLQFPVRTIELPPTDHVPLDVSLRIDRSRPASTPRVDRRRSIAAPSQPTVDHGDTAG